MKTILMTKAEAGQMRFFVREYKKKYNRKKAAFLAFARVLGRDLLEYNKIIVSGS